MTSMTNDMAIASIYCLIQGVVELLISFLKRKVFLDSMIYKLSTGKGSVGTQLLDSIGQTNRVILNITTDYNARTLAKEIRRFFSGTPMLLRYLN